MPGFERLVAARKQWIEDVLIPWCRTAPLKDLLRAQREWTDIAGKVDPQATLWRWAWGRFPGFVVAGLSSFDETYPVTVTLRDGTRKTGFPDAHKSPAGNLVLVETSGEAELGPFSIDDVQRVERGDSETT